MPLSPPVDSRFLLRVPSPLGRLELRADDDAVTWLSIERHGALPGDGSQERSSALLEQAAAELDEYFAGDRRAFDVPVRWKGTPFQQSVWEVLRGVDYGDALTYGAIGRMTGRPTAGRAIGGAVGANPVPILVPCHRVLASDGRITGYSAGSGVPTKVLLLDLEGIAHR